MVDLETREMDAHTLMGGWKLLCAGLLHQCVHRLVLEDKWVGGRLPAQPQGPKAEQWMAGGVGVITFEEACEAVSVVPSLARERIQEYVRANKRRIYHELRKQTAARKATQAKAVEAAAAAMSGMWTAGGDGC